MNFSFCLSALFCYEMGFVGVVKPIRLAAIVSSDARLCGVSFPAFKGETGAVKSSGLFFLILLYFLN